jgi:2-polyprenyl-3-methyl-5-hydroxy-6-metoxy-1,4-benzoquinol methylase
MRYTIFANFPYPLISEEFAFGIRLLAKMLPAAHWVIGNSRSFEEFWQSQETTSKKLTGMVVLLHSPYIVPGKDCLERLSSALESSGAESVLPVDPRGWGLDGITADYATLRGFERFNIKLVGAGQHLLPYDGRTPIMQMIPAERLRRLTPEHWMKVLTPPASALLVSDAIIHPYHDYYAGDRAEVVGTLPAGIGKLLDVGGGEGNFAALAKQYLRCEVHVVEMNPEAAAIAATKVDRVWVGDFLSLTIEERYDCVTLLDVVEHVVDPVSMLRRAAELLAPGGSIIASIPNIGHWTVVADLLEGRWDYLPVGITCWTHLRFFTLQTIRQTFHDAGLKVLRAEPVQIPAPLPMKKVLDSFTEAGLTPQWESLDAYVYHVVASRVA